MSTVEGAAAVLEAEEPPYPKSCKVAIDRLKGTISAFLKPSGAGLKMLATLRAGSSPSLKDAKDAFTAARAIAGLDRVPTLFPVALKILSESLTFARGSDAGGGIRSQIYRSACWLDELMYNRGAAEKNKAD